MADQQTTVAAPDTTTGNRVPAATLPDLNVGKYPWDFVQELVNKAAWLNMFIVPDSGTKSDDGGFGAMTGGAFDATIHRFQAGMNPPSPETGIRAKNLVGQYAGRFHMQWSLIPNDAQVRPGQPPLPPVTLDAVRSQRFVIQDSSFTFGDGADGFSGFGTGRLFPEYRAGEIRIHAMAIANIFGGTGKFSGLEGNFVIAGRLNQRGDIAGSILLRVVDPTGVLKAAGPLEPFIPQLDSRSVVPDVTFLLYNTAKSGPDQLTTFDIGPQGQIRGLVIPQQYTTAHVDFASASGGLQNNIEIGTNVIGGEVSFSNVDPTHPGAPGTADAPATFQGLGTYSFRGPDGKVVGEMTPQFLEGRTFSMVLAGAPDQIAARFGCFGLILEGDGYFAGADGFLVALSGVALLPHVFNCLQLVYMIDPDGKYLAGS